MPLEEARKAIPDAPALDPTSLRATDASCVTCWALVRWVVDGAHPSFTTGDLPSA